MTEDIFPKRTLERMDAYVRDAASDKLSFAIAGASWTGSCESPIEVLMLRALIAVFQSGYLGELSILSAEAFLALEEPTQFQLLPFACQVPIGEYRVDFAILVAAEPQYLLVIECDGHEFHERTKEQAQHDKARDRALQSQNIKIFRFTGSEIWRDPIACAREVYRMVETDIFDAARNDRSPA